jgi:hypothetical protein
LVSNFYNYRKLKLNKKKLNSFKMEKIIEAESEKKAFEKLLTISDVLINYLSRNKTSKASAEVLKENSRQLTTRSTTLSHPRQVTKIHKIMAPRTSKQSILKQLNSQAPDGITTSSTEDNLSSASSSSSTSTSTFNTTSSSSTTTTSSSTTTTSSSTTTQLFYYHYKLFYYHSLLLLPHVLLLLPQVVLL